MYLSEICNLASFKTKKKNDNCNNLTYMDGTWNGSTQRWRNEAKSLSVYKNKWLRLKCNPNRTGQYDVVVRNLKHHQYKCNLKIVYRKPTPQSSA